MRLATTFPTVDDWTRARRLLEIRSLAYTTVDPTPALRHVAAPALVVEREVCGELGGFRGSGVTCSGWVDYRPGLGRMPSGSPVEYEDDPFGDAAITELTPCIADDTKIRLAAQLTGCLTPALPYLNALMPDASYTPGTDTLTYMIGHRMVALYPNRIAIAKADEVVDAWLALEAIRQQVNEAWGQREHIEPCFRTRRKPPALEIFKRLPGSNCGLCGEMTCMAFAMRLWAGEVRARDCTPAFEPGNSQLRDALLEVCAALGLPADDSREYSMIGRVQQRP